MCFLRSPPTRRTRWDRDGHVHRATEFTKIVRADVREQFFYPPVGRTERQWDLFVEGAGEGTWPSETDPVWHPQPFYCRWETKR
jgi:hypothetical protein